LVFASAASWSVLPIQEMSQVAHSMRHDKALTYFRNFLSVHPRKQVSVSSSSSASSLRKPLILINVRPPNDS